MNRIRAGYCTTVNPYNRKQVSRVSLQPEDVDVIVFWTRNPLPLMPHLKELDERGLQYYFQYTLTGYPCILEPNLSDLDKQIDAFKRLADLTDPAKVIWRYDPIVLSSVTDFEYHRQQVDRIARALEESTGRLVVSVVDEYRKARYNFTRLARQNIHIDRQVSEPDVDELIRFIVDVAQSRHMEVFSCAEVLNLAPMGLKPGKCIDDDYIKKVFGIDVTCKKDKSQRLECGCVVSKDIGAYDTCLHGCLYCYAGTLATAQKNLQDHHVDSPSIIGRYK
jgi:DNA repair photolyase